jgi:hypothetical protein
MFLGLKTGIPLWTELRRRWGLAGGFVFLAMKTPKLNCSQAVGNVVFIVNVQILI